MVFVEICYLEDQVWRSMISVYMLSIAWKMLSTLFETQHHQLILVSLVQRGLGENCGSHMELKIFIVCTPTPPPFLLGGGWTSYQIFKKGSLIGPQLLEGGWWERSEWLFSGGCNFYIKDKVKSEIFNDKKSLKTQIFFCHNEEFELGNFNYEFSYF